MKDLVTGIIEIINFIPFVELNTKNALYSLGHVVGVLLLVGIGGGSACLWLYSNFSQRKAVKEFNKRKENLRKRVGVV